MKRRLGFEATLTLFALTIYLLTAGGHGYSIDGSFAFEMAKSAFLDPDHQYWTRFRTAFARWGVTLPILGEPFLLVGHALGEIAPERDDLVVDGHRFRIEEWPEVDATTRTAMPMPTTLSPRTSVVGLTVLSYLANGATVADGVVVAEVVLTTPNGPLTLPIHAGDDTAEWAWDRPDARATMRHRRAAVVGHWIGQPRGNIYATRLTLAWPQVVTSWEVRGAEGLGERGTWNVRAVAFQSGSDPKWHDSRTGERVWSDRQTRDFFAHLGFSATNAVVTALSVGMVWRLAGLLGFSAEVRLVTTGGYAFGTLAWPYAKFDFSEPAATLGLLVAAVTIYHAFGNASPAPDTSPRVPSPPPPAPTSASGRLLPSWPLRDQPDAGVDLALSRRQKRGVAAGIVIIAILMAVAAKYAAVLGVLALAIDWVVVARPWVRTADRRASFAFGAWVAGFGLVGATGAIGLAWATTGETPIILTSSVDRLVDDWFSLPFWIGFRGLLFSPGRSLFLYAPWLILAVPGIAIWCGNVWRGVPGAMRGLVLTGAYPIATILLYSLKPVWHGGSWGPRYLLMTVPFLALAAGPAIARAGQSRLGRITVGLLAVVSLAVQVVAISKDPEQFPAMVRRHVVATMPDFGADLGGRDYWQARGGSRLPRALLDPDPTTARGRSLGYLWGLPSASITVTFDDTRDVLLGLYAIDWDRQNRTQTVTIIDATGPRSVSVAGGMATGVWLTTRIKTDPDHPLTIAIEQTGADTAVLSAMTFDTVPIEVGDLAIRRDTATGGDWIGRYGRDGYVLFAFRSFNIDVSRLPQYITRYDLAHVGDRPHPTIHVEIAEDDLLDTALLYAPPFSPLLGNAWLLAADLLHLAVPSRPDLADGILIRPPWRWFAVKAPTLAHPEYGLGLDFWPTMIRNNYASHRGVMTTMWITVLVLAVTSCGLLWHLVTLANIRGGARWGLVGAVMASELILVILMVST